MLCDALALHRADRLDEARALYTAALATQEIPDALHMLGVVHLQTGDYRQALPLLRRAAEAFDWRVPGVRHNLGLAIAAALAETADDGRESRWAEYHRLRDRRLATSRGFDGRVSVVVPSYNHARFVGEALRSLACQTRSPDEIVVVDDGSTDASVAAIRDALPGLPGRTRLVQRANRGAAATLNEAIALSSGDWIAVLNSDDRFAPEHLASLVEGVAMRGAAWGFSRATCIDAIGAPVAPADSPRAAELHYLMDDVAAHDTVGLAFLHGNAAISSGCLFFAREVFDRLGGFAALRYNHDWEFCLRASVLAEPEFVPRPTYAYRLHGANTILESRSAALAEMSTAFASFYLDALSQRDPPNPFAPVPHVWGARFFESALGAGHASLLPPSALRDWAGRAAAALGEDAVA